MTQLPTNPSETTKKLNPHLWGNNRPMAQLQGAQRKPAALPPLDRGRKTRQGSKGCVVVCIVGLRRRRPLDSDNFIAGAKPLRDVIASSLCVDDADSRVSWEYGQVRTTGPEGTVVLISVL